MGSELLQLANKLIKLVFVLFFNIINTDFHLIDLALKIISRLKNICLDFFFLLQSELTVILFGALILLLKCIISYSFLHTFFELTSFFSLLQLEFFELIVDPA
jgi:hypothetical protein